MDLNERGQLVLFVYYPRSGECYFTDIILEMGVDLSDAPMIERAKREVLERGKNGQLVMARWGTATRRPLNVYLAKTDTVYHGDEAARIYRQSYGILRGTDVLDLPVAWTRFTASQKRARVGTKPRPAKALTIDEIAEKLAEYSEALKALGNG
jgi:hypothetical protein